jgi:hypothetical protein
MGNQENWIIEYLENAIKECEKTETFLIESGLYLKCNTDLTKARVIMKHFIDEQKQN